MKTELQKKLLEKYTSLFPQIKIYTGEMPISEEVKELVNQKEIIRPVQFGIECGDGWYTILDTLMDCIQHHIENTKKLRSNESKNRIIRYISSWMAFGSRNNILRKFGMWIRKVSQKRNDLVLHFEIDQIKEKFGLLCFYYSGGDNYIRGITNMAESMSHNTCEVCGTTNNVGKTSGWVVTICKSCNKKSKNINSWKKNK